MLYCTNCGRQFYDGATACDMCGSALAPMRPCPNCGMWIGATHTFCQYCGFVTETQKPKKTFSDFFKKKPVKFATIGVAAVAVILVVALLLPSILGSSASAVSKSVLVLKEEGLHFMANSGAKIVQVQDDFYDDDERDVESISTLLSRGAVITPDGSRLFYVEFDGEEINLCYKNPKKDKEEGTKIDSGIESYVVNAKGTKVIYLKEGKLYEHNLKEKEKIASDVESYVVSEDLGTVIYSTDDKIMKKVSGKDAEKIAGEGCEFLRASEDLSKVYYTKEDNKLYVKNGSEKAVKIASDYETYRFTENESVYVLTTDGKLSVFKADAKKAEKIDEDVIAFYTSEWESGDIYYLKSTSENKGLLQYVEDDLKESDEKMKEPVQPEYPDYNSEEFAYPEWPDYDDFDYPSYSDYDSYDEYEAEWDRVDALRQEAIDAYYEAYDEANEKWDAAVDEYYALYDEYEEAYDAYYEKERRDQLREDLENYEGNVSSNTLYYYNGKEAKEVLANVTSREDYAIGTPALIVSVTDPEQVEKVKISEVSYSWEVSDLVSGKISETKKSMVVVGTNCVEFDSEDKESISISDNAAYIYYKEDVSEDGHGDLFKAKVGSKKVEDGEKIDSDVYTYEIVDNDVVYFVDVDEDDIGTYCYNGKKVLEDVYMDNSDYDEETNIAYLYTDVDEDEECGTLYVVKGDKAQKICEDVTYHVVSGNGDIYMLVNYDMDDYEGELYVSTGKEGKLVDEEVAFISALMTTEQRLERGIKNIIYYNW